jgi:hypothetical protein
VSRRWQRWILHAMQDIAFGVNDFALPKYVE